MIYCCALPSLNSQQLNHKMGKYLKIFIVLIGTLSFFVFAVIQHSCLACKASVKATLCSNFSRARLLHSTWNKNVAKILIFAFPFSSSSVSRLSSAIFAGKYRVETSRPSFHFLSLDNFFLFFFVFLLSQTAETRRNVAPL